MTVRAMCVGELDFDTHVHMYANEMVVAMAM
jgi:hypothetical protein